MGYYPTEKLIRLMLENTKKIMAYNEQKRNLWLCQRTLGMRNLALDCHKRGLIDEDKTKELLEKYTFGS